MLKEKSGGMQILVTGAKPNPDKRKYPNEEEFQVSWSVTGGFSVGGIGHPGTPERPNYFKLSDYKTYIDLMTKQGVTDGMTEGHLLDIAAAVCLYNTEAGYEGEHDVSQNLLTIWKYGMPFYTRQLGYFPDASVSQMEHGSCDFIVTEEEPKKGGKRLC